MATKKKNAKPDPMVERVSELRRQLHAAPTTEVPLHAVVKERSLQCRVEMKQTTVDDYTELLSDGVEFPPVHLVRVDDTLLLVDGWHRYDAHLNHRWTKLGIKKVAAKIIDGSRSDATLLAIGANASHGLQRSIEDKRRAVRVLLFDPELCKLSSRAAKELLGVSHAFISQQRRRYGVQTGQVLDPERAAELDGALPPAWQEVYDGEYTYSRPQVLEARAVNDPAKFTRQHPRKAVVLRLSELAVEDWPFPEDTSAAKKLKRAKTADTVEDLCRLAVAKDLDGLDGAPSRVELLNLAWDAANIKKTSEWNLQSWRERTFKGRKAFVEAIKAREARVESRKDKQRQTRDFPSQVQHVEDAERIGLLVAAKSAQIKEVLWSHQTEPQTWSEAAREALRERVVKAKIKTEPCPLPDFLCTGWSAPDRYGHMGACVCCGATRHTVPHARDNMAEALLRIRHPLAQARYDYGRGGHYLDLDDPMAKIRIGLRLNPDLVLDSTGLDLLGHLATSTDPDEMLARVMAWKTRSLDGVWVLEPEPEPEPVPEVEAEPEPEADCEVCLDDSAQKAAG